jgi:hypothetical protein
VTGDYYTRLAFVRHDIHIPNMDGKWGNVEKKSALGLGRISRTTASQHNHEKGEGLVGLIKANEPKAEGAIA